MRLNNTWFQRGCLERPTLISITVEQSEEGFRVTKVGLDANFIPLYLLIMEGTGPNKFLTASFPFTLLNWLQVNGSKKGNNLRLHNKSGNANAPDFLTDIFKLSVWLMNGKITRDLSGKLSWSTSHPSPLTHVFWHKRLWSLLEEDSHRKRNMGKGYRQTIDRWKIQNNCEQKCKLKQPFIL